jgi:hypothetical protein
MPTGNRRRIDGARRARFVTVAFLVLVAGCAGAGAVDEPEPRNVRDLAEPEAGAPQFLTPEHGADVPATFTIKFDPGPIDITGETVPADAGGRFHVLVDRECLDNGEPFPPLGPDHLVIEPGASQLDVVLPFGAHDLCLQFGNAYDVAFYATDSMTVRVVE